MKSTKAVHKSYKKLISKLSFDRALVPNQNHGETVIPIGSNDLFVQLPSLTNTYTYNLINTAEMTGAITLKTSGGASLKGLILNNVGGTLNIEPIPQGATSFEMGSDVKDGCFVQTLSNGNNWFIWSVATHGTLGIGQVGNNNVSPSTSTTTQVPAPVTLNPIQSNTTFPPSANFEARHSIIISGDAEPGATIVISEESGLIGDITVTVEDDGSWSTNEITDLENEDYNFVFTPSVGEAATDQEFASNDGVLSFATPQSFTIERGEDYDFTVGASAVDTNNVLITPFNVDDSQYNTSLVHGATFDIVYSFNYLGTPYTRTVSGVVEDTIAPAKPTIASATFDSVNINDFTATGAAEDGSTVEIFFDGVSQGTVTSVGGTWSYTSTFVFNQTFEITVQATDSASNISEESDATSVVYSPPTLTRPTLTIVNAPINTWTNQANTIELSGTTDAGSTIVIKDGNVVVTPVSGPNYSGNNWDATINVADESNSSITIEASKANFNSPSPSIAKTLLVDRVPPAISGTPLGDLTVYLGNIGDSNDNIPTATDFSSATVASDWSTQVDATEGAKTVTYTATDLAGNTATDTRTVNVSTEVIIPVITSVTDLGNGTGTVEGTVTGTYADNLTVQVLVRGLDDGSPVEVSNGSFSYTTTNLGNGTFAINAITINSVGEESGLSNEETLPITASATQFLEESAAATTNLTNTDRVQITDGVFSRTVAQHEATYVNLSDEGVLSYGSNGERVHTAMTLSFWLRPDSDFQSGTKILGFLNATSVYTDGFGIRMGKRNGGANIELAPYIAQLDSTFRTSADFTPEFAEDQWYHGAIVVTEFDASGTSDVKLFINGVLGATDQIDSTLLQYENRSNFGIGTYMIGSSGETFQQSDNLLSLDSIQIADNVALSDSQVAAIYNQSDRQMTIAEAVEIPPTVTSPTIRVVAGNNANSLEHSTTAVPHGAAAYDIDEAAFILDNPSNSPADGTDFIEIPYSSDFDRPSNGDLTIQLWFNADRLPVDEGGGDRNFGLISRTDAGNTNDGGWIIALTTESGFSTGGIQATIFPTPHNRTLPSGGVTIGSWHHVALVIRNSGNATIYYDGQEISTYTYGTNSEAGALSKNYPLIIGGFSFNEAGTSIDQHFDGKIKGVTIDQVEISATEILNNYNNPPIEVNNGAALTTSINSSFSFIGFGDDAEDGELTPTTTSNPDPFDIAAENTYTIEHSVTDSASEETTHSFTVQVIEPQYLFLEDIPSVVARDASKFSLGIYNDVSSAQGVGMIVKLNTDGVLQYDPNTNETVNDEFTISWWMNLPFFAGAGNRGFVGCNTGKIPPVSGDVRNFSFDLGSVGSNYNNVTFNVSAGPAGQNTFNPNLGSIESTWTHVGATFKASGTGFILTIYLNGQPLPTTKAFAAGMKLFPPSTHEDFKFGAGKHTPSVKGQFDSMQIGDGVVLTDSQMLAIYNQSDRQMTIAEAAANEFGIASVIDDVYNDPTSTIVGSPTLTNSILEITGDDYIINGDIAEYMYQDYLSISFWIKSTEETQAAVNKFVSLGWSHAGNNKFGHVIGTQTTSPYNGFRVITPSGGALDETVPTGDWFDEQWHMLTLTWDNINGEKKFYYDGQQLGTTTTFSSKSDPFRDGDDLYGLIIGTGTGAAGGIRSGEAFRGKMTNMVINNFIWTDQQVSDLYDVNFNGNLHFSANIEEVGTLSGNASLVNGVLVSSALGDYTSMPMTSAFKSNSFQTISFWFKTTYTPTNGTWMRFIHSQVNGQGSNGFFIEMRSSTKIYFKGASQALVADNNPAAEAPSALNDGAWHQIIVSWEDLGVEKLRIWVDGAPMTVLDETLVGSGNDNKNTLFIGAKQFDSPMEMDKVAITEEFIDDAEALARYNYEAP
jgi:hypothetical protein